MLNLKLIKYYSIFFIMIFADNIFSMDGKKKNNDYRFDLKKLKETSLQLAQECRKKSSLEKLEELSKQDKLELKKYKKERKKRIRKKNQHSPDTNPVLIMSEIPKVLEKDVEILDDLFHKSTNQEAIAEKDNEEIQVANKTELNVEQLEIEIQHNDNQVNIELPLQNSTLRSILNFYDNNIGRISCGCFITYLTFIIYTYFDEKKKKMLKLKNRNVEQKNNSIAANF